MWSLLVLFNTNVRHKYGECAWTMNTNTTGWSSWRLFAR